MKKLTIFVILFLFNLNAAAGSGNSEVFVVTKFITEFAQLIQKKTPSKIGDIAEIDVKELANIIMFLADRKGLPYQKQSLSQLILNSQAISIMPVRYESLDYRRFGVGYTVFFIKNEADTQLVLSGKKKWLLDYAACDFFVRNNRVNFGRAFCYDGTEGPFFIGHMD